MLDGGTIPRPERLPSHERHGPSDGETRTRLFNSLLICLAPVGSTRALRSSWMGRGTRLAWQWRMGTILLVILVLMLLGAFPAWPHSRSWGYGPSGGLGLVVIILLILVLTGRL